MTDIQTTINALLKKAVQAPGDGAEALRFSQAALNVAHVANLKWNWIDDNE